MCCRLLLCYLGLIVITMGMSVDAGLAAETVAGNLLLSEDFAAGERLPEGWEPMGSGKVNISASAAHSGKYSLRVEDPIRTDGAGARSKPVPVRPGTEYVVTAWVKTESGAVQLHIQFFNDAGERVGGVSEGLQSAKNWALLRAAAVAPAQATVARAVVWGHVKNVGTAYYDDVQIVEVVQSAADLAMQMPITLVPAPNPYAGLVTSADQLNLNVKVHTHPRLLFTTSENEALKQDVEIGPVYHSLVSGIASSALSRTFARSFSAGGQSFPLPPQMPLGDDVPWQDMTMGIRSHLESLSLAYALTGDEKAAAAAKRDLLAMTQWQAWTAPGNLGTDFGTEAFNTTYITEGVAKAYDLLYDYLTPEERGQVRQAMIDKALRPLYNYIASTRIDHNKYIIRAAALGLGALALLGEEPGMDLYVRRAYEAMMWYFDERAKSGKTEGMNYLSVSLEHLIVFANALKRVTGDASAFAHPYIKDVLPRFAAYFAGPGGSGMVNFSDANISNYLATTMASIGKEHHNALANWYLVTIGAGGANRLFNTDLHEKAVPPADEPTSAVFPDVGWAALRSGWGFSDHLLAFISSGSNMGHNHLDQNHFVLNVGGDWLLTDPGYRDRSGDTGAKLEASFGSLGHNAVRINGQGQTIGGGGQIVGAFTSPVYDYVAGDAAKAYANTALQDWRRHIFYAKPAYFIILDELLTQKPDDQVDLLLHYQGSLVVGDVTAKVGYNAPVQSFTIRNMAQAQVQSIWPETVNLKVDVVQGAENYGPYASLTPHTNSRRINAITLLNPISGSEAGVTVSDIDANAERARFTVKSDAGTDYWWIGFSSQTPPTPSAGQVVNAAGVSTDGVSAMASVGADGAIERLVMLGGKHLYFNGQPVLQSDVEVSAACAFTANGAWEATLNAAADGKVQLRLPGGQTGEVAVKAGQNLLNGDSR